jgi:hypothetical protein
MDVKMYLLKPYGLVIEGFREELGLSESDSVCDLRLLGCGLTSTHAAFTLIF